DEIAGVDGAAAGGKNCFIKQAKRRSFGHGFAGERFHAAGITMEVQGVGVRSAGVTDFTGSDVDHDVKGGREHGGAGLAEHGGESAVDLSEQLAGVDAIMA